MNESFWRDLWKSDDEFYLHGSYRKSSYHDTLESLIPVMEIVGISRLAQVTHLDVIGIPVWQSIRPNSKNLTVSQGKGLNNAQAKVSAIMEAIEMFHAESPPIHLTDSISNLADNLHYSIYDLTGIISRNIIEQRRIPWMRGYFLDNGQKTLVPRDLINLDFTANTLTFQLFSPTSNGLSGGNTFAEAAIHGLYEIIERDSISQLHDSNDTKLVDPESIELPELKECIERVRSVGLNVQIEDWTAQTKIPCVLVKLKDSQKWSLFVGSACHIDRELAILKALLEACQSRLTSITGSRDDISDLDYMVHHSSEDKVLNLRQSDTINLKKAKRNDMFRKVVNSRQELTYIIRTIKYSRGTRPIIVDLSKPEVNIPIVLIVAPGMKGPNDA